MSRELSFTGWWEGDVEYSCDNCGKTVKIPFDDEASAKAYKEQRATLKNDHGWTFTKVNDVFVEFCCEACRNAYIRRNTI